MLHMPDRNPTLEELESTPGGPRSLSADAESEEAKDLHES